MSAPPAEDGARFPRDAARPSAFEQAVLATAAADASSVLEVLEPGLAIVLAPSSGERIVLAAYPADDADAWPVLHERLAVLAKLARPSATLVLFGGDTAARRDFARLANVMSRHRLRLVHLPEDAPPWQSTAVLTPLGRAAVQTPAAGARLDWRPLAAAARRGAALAAETHAFMSRRHPVRAAPALLAVLVAVFTLELVVGHGSIVTPVLMRLGALSGDAIARGELWRLASSAFLHASVPHVALNAFVLWRLGGDLERLLGSARVIVILGLSALAGAAASAFFHREGISVGASGGLWGLLGAQAVLVLRRADLLPAASVPAARKAATSNLVLNLAVSFLPHIDWLAHVGGGVAGAALVASSLVTVGLPGLASADRADHPPRALRPLATVVAGALVLGLVTAVVVGRPLALRRNAPFESVTLEALGARLALPAGLGQAVVSTSEPSGATTARWGRVPEDPVTVYLATARLPEASPAAAAAAVDADLGKALASWATAPNLGAVAVAPQRVTIAGHPGATVSYRYPSGVLLERAVVFVPAGQILVDAFVWPTLADAGQARRIAESVTFLPPAPGAPALRGR